LREEEQPPYGTPGIIQYRYRYLVVPGTQKVETATRRRRRKKIIIIFYPNNYYLLLYWKNKKDVC
jgi:hypothetical protein